MTNTGSLAKRAAALALGLAATTATAQGTGKGAAEASRSRGDLSATCIALLNGEAPQGVDPAALRPQCASLLRDATSSAPRAEAAAVGTAAPSAGSQVRAAFGEAGREIVGRGVEPSRGYGTTSHGPARSLLTTNPIGWFSGLGVNATLSRALESFPKLSWIAGARYARANASTGNVTSVGLGTGVDFFVIGGDNEGLRIGPRFELAFGTENIGGTTTYARLGLSGELGYNFIASNGLSATAAVGLGGRIAGDSQNENFTSFTGGELGPYLKVGIGYAF